ncbi:MAG: ABC transporter substrate-binding protein [Rhizomicrobium sp.]
MFEMSLRMPAIARRGALALMVAAANLFAAAPASAAPPAEAFIATNVAKGLTILNNTGASEAQRKSQFQTFILGLTNMRRIANFTLGQYYRTASPQEQDQFAAAFQNYAVAVYQSYFAKYSGQTLQVFGSQERAPGDTIVQTHLIDPSDTSGKQPLEVDFRVVNDNGRMVIIDFGVAGIWIAIEEQAQFTSFLGNNNGSIAKLIADVNAKRKQVEAGTNSN